MSESTPTLPPDPDAQATLPPTLADVTAPADAAPADGVRYRVLRSHARGGLGEVFVALDTEVGREVALKEIQGDYADDPASQGRFLREAEVNGRLEHPSIVPVYGLGRHPDGRPYYAMRFIRGETLDAAARRFHNPLPSPPLRGRGVGGEGVDDAKPLTPNPSPRSTGARGVERNLEFRQLLTRFIAVCNAVAYAHSRGVLHRDIKPANVMLGKFGETLLVDWGLAKVIPSWERRERHDEGELASEAIDETHVGRHEFASFAFRQRDVEAVVDADPGGRRNRIRPRHERERLVGPRGIRHDGLPKGPA